MKLKILDDLNIVLAYIPRLVDAYDRKDPNFIPELKKWLALAENVLAENRRHEISRIAGLRSRLISAERGIWDPKDISIEMSKTEKSSMGRKRKLALAVGGQVINTAQSILSDVIEPLELQVKEATEIIRQLLLIASQKELVPLSEMSRQDRDVRKIWVKLINSAELRPGTQKVLSLISFPEALCIIDDIFKGWDRDAREQKYERKATLTVLPGGG